MHFFSVNELKLTEFELFSFSHFKSAAANEFKLFCMAHLENNRHNLYTILTFHFKHQILHTFKLPSLS